MANKIALNIAGFNLIINTQEDEAQVRKLNETLNEDLRQILAQNPSASVTNAALLCALDYLDRFDKATHSASNMRDQIKDYMSDASNAKLQYDDEVRKNTELAAEIENLRARITKMASEGAAGSAVEQSLRAEIDSLRNELGNVRAQLTEQIDKNSSILSDFGILNNALRNKDNEIYNLSERVAEMNNRLSDSDSRITELTDQLNTALADRDGLAAQLEDARNNVTASAPVISGNSADLARPEPVSFSFPDLTNDEEDITEDLEDDDEYEDDDEEYEDDDEYDDDDEYEDDDEEEDDEDEVEDEVSDPVPVAPVTSEPAVKSAPKKDYRFFDYEDGAIENQDGEVGVGDGFMTFGQMIAEERKQAGSSYEEANSSKFDDDALPNLSWINDID